MTPRQRRVITLTTDFGRADHYVGVLHGVILGLNPEAHIVDLSHSIAPQDINAAAFLIGQAWPYFPANTIHVVVVDPGVGGERQALVLASPAGVFVAPDNGVLSTVIRSQSPGLSEESRVLPAKSLGQNLRAIRLTNSSHWRPQVSATFHGRDIFAPVAAHLSKGVSPDRFGEPASTLYLLPHVLPSLRPDGVLVAHVVHIDRFGNLITDLASDEAARLPQPVHLRLRGQTVEGLQRYFTEGPRLMALVGSSDRVEIAVRNGSAAEELGAQVGDEIEVL